MVLDLFDHSMGVCNGCFTLSSLELVLHPFITARVFNPIVTAITTAPSHLCNKCCTPSSLPQVLYPFITATGVGTRIIAIGVAPSNHCPTVTSRCPESISCHNFLQSSPVITLNLNGFGSNDRWRKMEIIVPYQQTVSDYVGVMEDSAPLDEGIKHPNDILSDIYPIFFVISGDCCFSSKLSFQPWNSLLSYFMRRSVI